jgi:tetratricopeptide (TPR) repeat protein
MASIIPGYEYDIFISYRQKDNKGDKWVSEFVDALKAEIEATFKEDISIYFDENPHDRLQETYDVNKSLEGKLKCLIFIPVLSQTYCDPNSYAWKHEFLAFKNMTENDSLGKYVKLRNSNITSRILPIRLHDLDSEDIKLFEKVTGGVLRTLDFVFRTSSGVNRPLRANEDHPNDNINKTFYRDQINKTANAIKEIIEGLKAVATASANEETQVNLPGKVVSKEELRIEKGKPDILRKRKFLSRAIIFLCLITIILAYPKVFQTRKTKVARDPNGKISIAVNTFDNLTGDTTLNYWGLGIQELLINNLGNSDELSVQNSQTIYEVYESFGQTKNASVVPSLSREAAMKLKASTYITGSYQKTGNKIIMLVKLIDTQDDEVLWTSKIDGSPHSNYTDLADSISTQVKNFLEIKSLKQKTSLEFREAFSNFPEAYRIYVKGMNSFMNADYISAIQSYKEALEIDSTFTLAAFYIANAYNILGGDQNNRQGAKWTQRAFRGKERLPENYQHWLENWEAFYITKNSKEVLKTVSILENSEIRSRYYWLDIGCTYIVGGMYDKAIKPFEKVEAINSEWGGEWKYLDYYTNYGTACHHTGNHKKEAEIFETGLKIFPDNMFLLFFQATCAISENDTVKAPGLIRKLTEAARKVEASESQIEAGLGLLYREANSLDKAEEHYRRAVQINPSDPLLMNDLASFLIRYDRNIDEGMKLIKRALEILPGKGSFLWTQGRGYYKQGKFEEAYSILNVAKDSILTWSADLNKQILDARNALDNQRNRSKL